MKLSTGMVVQTYDKSGTGVARAELLEKEENPDLEDLIDCQDITRSLTKTILERWEVRFIGDPANHTSMRWIDPTHNPPPREEG